MTRVFGGELRKSLYAVEFVLDIINPAWCRLLPPLFSGGGITLANAEHCLHADA
jgi:hypothetical protein